jgi:ankyrin repeat protein
LTSSDETELNLNVLDKLGRTALHLAAAIGHTLAGIKLRDRVHVKEEEKQDYDGRTVLHELAQKGHHEAIEALMQKRDINLDLKDCRGRTTLHCSADRGPLAVMLLMKQANRSVKDNDRDTALHRAAKRGHDNVAKDQCLKPNSD